MQSANRIVELPSLITRQTTVVNGFLGENKLPTPSLDLDALQSPYIETVLCGTATGGHVD
ncbi:hypothetical protein GGS24DRAFT_446355 [Hypoxylon argillaceum]|nr:hypothetical protein GGS24DRAFT_446355 [Hypoxylon argillaceum]